MELEGRVSGTVGVSEVTIIKNTQRLQDPDPQIIPINNSMELVFKRLDLPLQRALLKSPTLIIQLDRDSICRWYRVLVGVGIASTGYGYNSNLYDYDLLFPPSILNSLVLILRSVLFSIMIILGPMIKTILLEELFQKKISQDLIQ